jgi:hypothetical protein
MKVEFRLEAMALEVPKVANHPNRMPFSGILTRLDEPSDAAPHGSGGKRVLMTSEAAQRALPSLLGMGVDLTADLDGHDPTAKVGVITGAHIDGNAIQIEGFVYAADFPKQALRIHLDQAKLGFSFEAQQIAVESLQADPLIITDCVFTGAAILMKDAAAYRTTALAASAAKNKERGEFKMDEETKKAIGELLASAIQPVTSALGDMRSDLVEQGKKVDYLHERVEANAVTMGKVEPLASGLEKVAASMEQAGVGLEPNSGHVVHLRKMASHMRAKAAMGELPASYPGHGYYASADGQHQQVQQQPAAAPKFEDTDAYKALKSAADAATAQVAELGTKLAAAADANAGLETQIKDLKAGAQRNSPEPERKTLTPQIQRLLAKEGVGEADIAGGKPVSADIIAKATAGMSISERMRFKANLANAGLIDPSASA